MKKISIQSLIAACALVSVLVYAAHAQGPAEKTEEAASPSIVTVTNTNDSGPGSLRQAVASAAANDTIIFQAGLGTINLNTPIAVDKNLTIDGGAPNAQGISGQLATRIFDLGTVNAAINVTLNGLNIRDGRAPLVDIFTGFAGGAIYSLIEGSNTLTITNSTFHGNAANGTGNSSVLGGAVALIPTSGNTRFSNVTFTENAATGSSSALGGAVVVGLNHTAIFINCTFTGNSVTAGTTGFNAAGLGGAIAAPSGTINVAGSTFTNNSATGGVGDITDTPTGGGAIHVGRNSTIQYSTFTGNSTSGTGGAAFFKNVNMFLQNERVAIEDSTFWQNTATGFGGAVGAKHTPNTQTLTINRSTLIENQAYAGGAIFQGNVSGGGQFDSIHVLNSTIADNTVSGFSMTAGQPRGGGVAIFAGNVSLVHCTIVRNTVNAPQATGPPSGGGVFGGANSNLLRVSIVAQNTVTGPSAMGPDLSGSFQNPVFNFIGRNAGHDVVNGIDGNQVGTTAVPLDPHLGPLQNNGGLTLTMAPAVSSPVVDAGALTADLTVFPIPVTVTIDQRAAPRPVDLPQPNPGNGADIGAVELQTATAAEVSVSGSVLTHEGRGLTNASVTLTDDNGVSRTAITGRIGAFRFEGVEAGRTYIVSVASRRYSFSPLVVSVHDDITDLDIKPE